MKIDEVGYWSELKLEIIKKYAGANNKAPTAKRNVDENPEAEAAWSEIAGKCAILAIRLNPSESDLIKPNQTSARKINCAILTPLFPTRSASRPARLVLRSRRDCP